MNKETVMHSMKKVLLPGALRGRDAGVLVFTIALVMAFSMLSPAGA
jgi:hypothetical protein